MERNSKPIPGTLHKRMVYIPEQDGMLSVKPMVACIEIVFTGKDRVLVVRETYYDSKAEMLEAYRNLNI